jgi:uncharacterized membrane protein YphA (DoxX/SURF4 family)
MMLQGLVRTTAPRSTILIRVLAGWVFLSEGLQKFLFSEAFGIGRFERIGIIAPQVRAPFVGVTEIACGLLILLGLMTRLACIPLLAVMSAAILSTKVPILLGHGFWGINLPKMPQYGLWTLLHEARVDFSMGLALLFLLIVGGGPWSIDARIDRTTKKKTS